MKKIIALCVFLCCLPTVMMADMAFQRTFVNYEGREDYVNVFRSDIYPDLEFIFYTNEEETYARAINGATNVYVPHEVYLEGFCYDEGENGEFTLQTTIDKDGKVKYNQFKQHLTIKGVDFDRNTGLESFELEEGITCVRCYKCTNLREVKLPRTITDLSSNSWDVINYPFPTPADDYDYTDFRSIYFGSFMGCTSLESISIPWEVEKIDGTFVDCTNLKEVTYLDNEWSVHTPARFETMDYTFAGCSSLEWGEIPDGVNSLVGTFRDCTSLLDVEIPSSVTDIGGAFWGCTSLANAAFLSGKPNIRYMFESFYGCTSLKTAVVPEGVETIYEAFKNCSSLETVTINSRILNNMNFAFYECKKLRSVEAYDVLDKKMHSPENGVYIPSTVEKLTSAFWNCQKIEQVVFADNCTFCQYYKNAENAFGWCLNLSSVVLPQNLKGIPTLMFYLCLNLKGITIPGGVERIMDYAFSECISLETITFEGRTPPFVASTAFAAAEQDKKGIAPLGSMNNYKSAFRSCNAYNKRNGFGQIIFSSSPSEVVIVGDVNGDYQVTVEDKNELVDIILGKTSEYNKTAADVNKDGEVTIADVTALVNIILGNTSGEIPAFVDLGLPSGTLWATCNVGAEVPEEFGEYFAWGETDGDKDTYDWNTYKWCEGKATKLTKYNSNKSYGIVDDKTSLDLEDDAAYVNMGLEWCTPTSEQFKELINSDYTTAEWTKQNWAFGYKITSKTNGNSIFLPAAGYYSFNSIAQEGEVGAYWSSSLGTKASSPAILLEFMSGFCVLRDGNTWNGENRMNGGSIRPVRKVEQ